MTDEVQGLPQPDNAGTNSEETTNQTSESELRARALGWKSPDDWKGELPSGYIAEPEKYVDWVTKNPGVKALEKKLQDVEAAQRKYERVMELQLQRTTASYQAELKRLEEQKIAAVEVGDVEQYKALQQKQAELSQQIEPPKEQGIPPEVKADIDQWAAGKTWFGKGGDALKTQAAAQFWSEAEAKGITTTKAILAHVDARMAETFADMRQVEQKAPPQTVEAGLTFPGVSGGDAFSKLPKDAQSEFKRMVAKGWFNDTKEDRAQYAKDYNDA